MFTHTYKRSGVSMHTGAYTHIQTHVHTYRHIDTMNNLLFSDPESLFTQFNNVTYVYASFSTNVKYTLVHTRVFYS